MIAFHYPPFQGSSGILRTWNFTKLLPELGWQPLLLTASERAYGKSLNSSSKGLRVPEGLLMWRAMGFDAARDLSIRGRYPHALALPDRWASWYVPAVLRALRVVRQHRPSVIWSTYPIATALLVGLTVHRLTGLPWVADFRDSMTEEGYPAHPWDHRAYSWIEKRVVANAQRLVFTTPGSQSMYLARYADLAPQRTTVIANGYSEDDFAAAGPIARAAGPAPGRPLRLVHSGILYPSERDPRPFFDAVAKLKVAGMLRAEDVTFAFRASGHDPAIREMVESRGIGDLVSLAEPLDYHAALAEMLQAHGLLLFQAANCNHQIPAKVYEYLRAGRPILALTDRRGDTAAVLEAAGAATIVDIANSGEIAAQLPSFLERVRAGTEPCGDAAAIRSFSRRAGAESLSRVLEACSGDGSPSRSVARRRQNRWEA